MTRKLSRAFIAVAMLLLVVVPSAADDYDFDAEDMLPLRIPLNRAWDVQWNPPGHSILSVSQLGIPIGEPGAEYLIFPEEDEGATRTGYYTFVTTASDSVGGGEISRFVRMTDEKCLIPIFGRVEFLVQSNEVLLFRGKTPGISNDFFNLLQGRKVETAGAGPAGVLDYWTTQPVTETLLTPKEWLFQNFMMDDGDRSTTTTIMDGDNDDEFTMCEVEDDYEYVYDFDTPMTTATLSCDENEELFQLSYLSGQTRWVSYKVTTRATDEVHAECNFCENDGNNKERDVQLCLPKDQCYTVVVGDSIRWDSCSIGGSNEEVLLVQWAGETLRRNNAYLFDRIDFGDGCSENFFCNPTDEMEFEFFFARDIFGYSDDLPTDYSWSLTEAGFDDDDAILSAAAPPIGEIFMFERICVPKRSSCLEFTIGYSDNTVFTDRDSIGLGNLYSIRLDGVIYADKKLRLGREGNKYSLPDFEISPLSHTDYLGTNCTVEQVCNATANDLIAMEFTTNSVGKECFSDFGKTGVTTFGSVIQNSDMLFWISPEQSSTNYLYNSFSFTNMNSVDDFETNTTYRSMVCIPNDECTKFYWVEDNPDVDYKIYQNGNELTERTNSTGSDYFGSPRAFSTKTGVCAAGSTVGGGKRIWLVSVVATLLLATV